MEHLAPMLDARKFPGGVDDSDLYKDRKSGSKKGGWKRLKFLISILGAALLAACGAIYARKQFTASHEKDQGPTVSATFAKTQTAADSSFSCPVALDSAFSVLERHKEEMATKAYTRGSSLPKLDKKYHPLFLDISKKCLTYVRYSVNPDEGRFDTFSRVWDIIHGP